MLDQIPTFPSEYTSVSHLLLCCVQRHLTQRMKQEDNSNEHSAPTMDISNYPIMKAFVAGSCSGTCSALLFQPLDLVKTRLQTTVPTPMSLVGAGSTSVSVRSPGMFTVIGHILQKEQLFGLWRGITPSVTRCVPGVGLYFSSLHFLTNRFTDGNPGPLEAVCLGIIARSLSGVCLIPITVVKTRYESGVYNYNSMMQALRGIYVNEGFRGLTCGLVPTLLRDAPFSGIYLMFYTQMKKNIPAEWLQAENGAFTNFSCGIVAGLLASTITQPADVLKTKMQLYPNKFPNFHSVVIYVYKKYGPMGYFKGLSPRIVRRSLMAAMAWTVYEQVLKCLSLK